MYISINQTYIVMQYFLKNKERISRDKLKTDKKPLVFWDINI